MKILIVTNYLPPKIGGIERISHELATALNLIQGVEVSVVSAKWPSKFLETDWGEIDYLYEVLYVPSITIFRRLPVPNIFRRQFWAQMGDLNDDFDLVFYQSHLFVLNWIIAVKLRRMKRRIWMNHGCNYVPINSRVGSRLSFLYERLGMTIMKSFCNEFVGQSKNTAEWMALKVGIPFQVLSNAINMQQFNGENEFEDRKLKTSVLFVGRLVEGKGLLDCISAVSEANQMLRHSGSTNLLTLTVVGSGPLKDSVSNHKPLMEISWRGELSHSQVIASMYQHDILIQAYSQPEGLTTVTLEGLAAGMLIVTTPVSGEGDLDGSINYVPGALSELPSLLLKSRDRAEKRSELVSTGRQFIEAGFTWDIIAKKLILQDYSNV